MSVISTRSPAVAVVLKNGKFRVFSDAYAARRYYCRMLDKGMEPEVKKTVGWDKKAVTP